MRKKHIALVSVSLFDVISNLTYPLIPHIFRLIEK